LTSLDGIRTIVVDNASDDGTADLVESEFPQATLIRRRRNGGFAKAVNDALRAAPQDDILLVNPDVVVEHSAVGRLVSYLTSHPKVGIAAPRLRYPDGSWQESARFFPNPLLMLVRRSPLAGTSLGRKFLRRYLVPEDQLKRPRPVHSVIGAAMLIRRRAIDEVGGMAEWIFLYGEDLEWCIRMWRAGWEVHVVPEATFIHEFTRLSRRTLDFRSAPVRHHWASLVKLYARYPGLLIGRGPSAAHRATDRF
jgi:GT2 family glycosyltransferase